MKRHTLSLPGDLRLGVAVMPRAPGAAPGRSFVLLHGLGDNAAVWLGVMPALAALGDVVAIELPGHGDSTLGPESGLNLFGMADAVRAALAALALPRPVLVGHSLGAAVAEVVAVQAPEHVAALVTVDHAADLPGATRERLRAGLLGAHQVYADPAGYAAVLSARHPGAALALLQQVAAASLKPCAQGWLPAYDPAAVAVLAAPSPGAERHRLLLAQLLLPVLVVRGAWSWLLAQGAAQRMAAACRHGQMATVSRAGHGVPLDNPAGLARAIVAFAVGLGTTGLSNTRHCGEESQRTPAAASAGR